MASLVHQLISESARRYPDRVALRYKDDDLTYRELDKRVAALAGGLVERGLKRRDRVAVYAEKRFETVIAMFAASRAGGAFVPVNPLLKAEQVAHVLADSGARLLITTGERLKALGAILPKCPELCSVICIDGVPAAPVPPEMRVDSWEETLSAFPKSGHRMIDHDMAAIVYTSGSSGRPKGVVLSHRNIVAGAESVAEYLELRETDRLLSVLPLSFDYGMNQLTTAFLVGGCVVLMNYLFPKDVLAAVAKEKITGLAAVPPLWIQLAQLRWAPEISEHLRYITNSGGHMPGETLRALRAALPRTKPYLMYGLTESFRSTYLSPSEIDRRPDSIGKAVPNAEIFVVRPDGALCAPHEPGELVHRGALVSLGYWNNPAKTASRFKPIPSQCAGLPGAEIAVWSGDTVKTDEEGFIYYIGRTDDMIKTSGYRVSPTEIEEVLYGTRMVTEAAVFGVPHPVLGQAIAAVVTPVREQPFDVDKLKSECLTRMPSYMVPAHFGVVAGNLPRNSNGKIDRALLAAEKQDLFQGKSK